LRQVLAGYADQRPAAASVAAVATVVLTSPVPEPVGGRIRRGPILRGLINEYETAA
jgi:hypothetical protein